MTEPLAQKRADADLSRPANEMIKRVVSAVVLGSIGIAVTLAGQWPLAVLVALISVILAWEWGRLVRRTHFDDRFVLHAAALVLAVAFVATGWIAAAWSALAAGTALVAVRRFGNASLLSAIGVPYVGAAALAIVWLRGSSDLGLAAVVLVFACVWAHDTLAMLVGRAVGGPRLWPSVSPKKTWSGAVAGWVASAGTAMLGLIFLPNASLVWLAALGFAIGIAALLGDLAESSLKRHGGVKNTSGLIPGHGGFLDRLDGAVASFVLAGILAACLDWETPARGLLYGP